jgi:hypothetical protein
VSDDIHESRYGYGYIGTGRSVVEARKKREEQLPEWAHGLTARVQGVLLNERYYDFDHLPDLSIETVRAYGERRWLRASNMGEMGVRELGEAIGGWTETKTIQQELSAFSDTALVTELRRRGYTVTRDG